MRVIFAILFFLSLILWLIFLSENSDALGTAVSIHYNIIFFKLPEIQVPVWAVALIMFGSGIIVTFFLEMIGYFKTRSNIVVLKKKIKGLEKEIQDRRTVYADPLHPPAEKKESSLLQKGKDLFKK